MNCTFFKIYQMNLKKHIRWVWTKKNEERERRGKKFSQQVNGWNQNHDHFQR